MMMLCCVDALHWLMNLINFFPFMKASLVHGSLIPIYFADFVCSKLKHFRTKEF